MGRGFPEELRNLYNYFIQTYVGEGNSVPRFPPHIWSQYEILGNDLPRTNNAIEGWHNAFKGRLTRTASSLPKLMHCFHFEEMKRRQKTARVLDSEILYRRNKYVYLNSQILTFISITSLRSRKGKRFILRLTNFIYY